MKTLHIIALAAGIIWTGPKLTTAQLADILKPNEYKSLPSYDGPTIVILSGQSVPWPINDSYHQYQLERFYGRQRIYTTNRRGNLLFDIRRGHDSIQSSKRPIH